MIATITPTRGDRPQFLANCKQQLARMNTPVKSYFIDYPPKSSEIDLIARVREGIRQAKADGFEFVFIVEDDDFFPADYFDNLNLLNTDFIGDQSTIYYHLKFRAYQDWEHENRASLFTTGFRISSLFEFVWPDDNERFLDVSLWRYATQNKKIRIQWRKTGAIGIKHGIGLCGGKGHIQRGKYQDQSFEWLKNRVDLESYEFYTSMFKK